MCVRKSKPGANLNVQLCYLSFTINVPGFCLRNLHACPIFFFNRMNEAQNRPRREYTPKPKPIFDFGDVNHSNGGYTSSMAPPPSRNSGKKQAKCLWSVSFLICIRINALQFFVVSNQDDQMMFHNSQTLGRFSFCPQEMDCFSALRHLPETMIALDMQTESVVFFPPCFGIGVSCSKLCCERFTIEMVQLLKKGMSVCVCDTGSAFPILCLTLISAGRFLPADLASFSCDIIRSVFSVGQAVPSQIQTLWVTDSSMGTSSAITFVVISTMQWTCTVSGVKM